MNALEGVVLAEVEWECSDGSPKRMVYRTVTVLEERGVFSPQHARAEWVMRTVREEGLESY